MGILDAVRCSAVEDHAADPRDAEAAIEELRLEAAAEEALWGSMRRSRRGRMVRELSLRPVGMVQMGPPICAFSYDVSEGGLGVVSSRALPLGVEVSVGMMSPTGALLHLEGYVIRCRPVAGWYDLGVVFYREYPALRCDAFRAGGD